MLTLSTKRLDLVPLSQEDFPFVQKAWSNPSVMRYIGEGLPFSDEQAQTIFDTILTHQAVFGYSLQKVVVRGSGPIGYAGLIHYELDAKNSEVEVGYLFDEPYWGKGFATEIVSPIVAWGLNEGRLPYIVGVTNPLNVASRCILQKAGLRFVGKGLYRGREVDRFETPH